MSTPRRALGDLPPSRSRNPHTYGRRREPVPPRISEYRKVDENIPPGGSAREAAPTNADNGNRKEGSPGPGNITTGTSVESNTSKTLVGSDNSITSTVASPQPKIFVEVKTDTEGTKETMGLKRKPSRNGNIMDFFKKRPNLGGSTAVNSEHGFVNSKSDPAIPASADPKQHHGEALPEANSTQSQDDTATSTIDNGGRSGNTTLMSEDSGHGYPPEKDLVKNNDNDNDREGEDRAEQDDIDEGEMDETAHDDNDEDSIQIPQIRLFGRKHKSAKSRGASNRPKPVLQQATIDLGQKMEVDCKECGMSYVPSNKKDKEMHDKFHKSYLQVLTWSDTQVHVWSGTLPKELDHGVIICISGHSSTKEQKKASEIVEQVEGQLGSVQDSWGGLGGVADRKVYLYVVRKKTLGCLVVERIQKAYPALVTADGMIEEDLSKGAREVIMGISRIWVASTNRRKGIASKLIECAQATFVYGAHVKKEQVAFSQPTESGGRFAGGWWGGNGWLVYDQDKAYNAAKNDSCVGNGSA
ncbi:hypothetical protein BJ508DRAFT_416418 [Ascobolus immersus RN42]|uniref:N-acetyltransferase ECO1 n=1 Tax=Ascobolus immersus RN42 TaxID=1160509 RepID=A0A3N4IAA7_ASCIM|nr:hypothetical protein BJ508DRAFT_416418 [Ascobolus immersus RN42]